MLHLRNTRMDSVGPSFDSWHQTTCRDFSLTECEIHKNEPFSGSVRSWKSGPLAFGDVAVKSPRSHMPLIRSETDIRKDPRDHIMLYLVTKGEVGLAQSGRAVTVNCGEVVLYDQAKPFTLDFIGDARGLVMAVPRSHATTRLENVAGLTARSIGKKTLAARFTRSVLSQFQPEEGGEVAGISPKMQVSALDLIFGSIEHFFLGPDQLYQGHRPEQLRKVKEYLVHSLADTSLSIDKICLTQGVSARSLNRLFSSEGTTPMRWLWQMRLDAAYRLIGQDRSASITDIAFDTGFTDVSHFSRAFKKAFGQTASSLLRQGTVRAKLVEAGRASN
jgi:AraC-like DNA-binding protein